VKNVSRQEAAVRGGVDTPLIDQLVALGILSPDENDSFNAADLRRIILLHSLKEAGIPLDVIAATLESGALSFDFLDLPYYSDRFSVLTSETFREVGARTGVPLNLLVLIREVTGFPVPQPDDRIRENELAIVPFLELQVTNGFHPSAIERLMRVQGDSMRRLAETEADWWQSEVIAPAIAAGKPASEVADADFSPALTAATEAAMLAIWHAQEGRAWATNIVASFEEILSKAGLHTRTEQSPAICFLDVTGYTRLTQERGDEAAAHLAEQLTRLVQRTSVQHAGRPIKWLGDGVMFYFKDPAPGVMAALEMVDGVAAAGLPPAHVGLHSGPVLFQEGDYYGQTVNVASRIAEYARPGEVLVSQEVVAASGEAAGVSFAEIGPVELKGVAGAIRLSAAHRA
jgi:adenylate cyclase